MGSCYRPPPCAIIGMPTHKPPFKIGWLVHKKGLKLGKASEYDRECGFCHNKGHSAYACPLQQTIPLEDEKEPFVTTLLTSPQIVAPVVYKGLTGLAAWEALSDLGDSLNKGNPWVGSTLKTDWDFGRRLGPVATCYHGLLMALHSH